MDILVLIGQRIAKRKSCTKNAKNDYFRMKLDGWTIMVVRVRSGRTIVKIVQFLQNVQILPNRTIMESSVKLVELIPRVLTIRKQKWMPFVKIVKNHVFVLKLNVKWVGLDPIRMGYGIPNHSWMKFVATVCNHAMTAAVL